MGDHAVLCRVLRYFLMYVDSRDISITPHLMMRGIWEPWITMAIARHVQSGMRCIDVGANCGYYTTLLAQLVGPRGHVLAVEPNPRQVELLQRTLSTNGFCDIVEVAEVGASDHEHQAVLCFPPGLHGGARLSEAPGAATRCVPLDKLCPGKWDFIKIDVEGMEREVIHGLRETLDRQEHVTIVVEVTPYEWLPDTPEGFLEAMKLQGFSVGLIEPDASVKPLESYDRLPKEKGQWEMLWLSR